MILGLSLGLVGASLPTWLPLCQARAAGRMATHSCCRGGSSCPAQWTKQPCCGSSANIPASSQVNLQNFQNDLLKYGPVLGVSVESAVAVIRFASRGFASQVLSFSSPPPFLKSHSWLC